MPVIIAEVSKYSEDYVNNWMKENNIDIDTALDQILTSIRDEAEGK